ncbi:unnamed protein product [Protopolystoma xenopodis]|uniref:Uncharacterized protein n=1 Tax=Protopolystoma xenopodis TaxID=117903 RepID=A0A448WNE8_9PLAT|nr:unnamed protein product [Protopolystoma xenopodis]
MTNSAPVALVSTTVTSCAHNGLVRPSSTTVTSPETGPNVSVISHRSTSSSSVGPASGATSRQQLAGLSSRGVLSREQKKSETSSAITTTAPSTTNNSNIVGSSRLPSLSNSVRLTNPCSPNF